MSDMELYRRLGRAVADRREALPITQGELAKQVGLSRASIANLENGRQRIMLHQLYDLVRALQLKSITELAPPQWESKTASTRIKVSGGVVLSPAQHKGIETFFETLLAEKPRGKRKK
jgi:transcriptional regulator with XRE-family HTH domain